MEDQAEIKQSTFDALTKSQKKNYRKSQRAKQKKKETATNDLGLNIPLPEDVDHVERLALINSVQVSLKELINLENVPYADLKKAFETRKTTLESFKSKIQTSLDDIKKIPKIDTRQFSSKQIVSELQAQCQHAERDEETINYFLEQYERLIIVENAIQIRPELTKILELVQKKLESDKKYYIQAVENKKMSKSFSKILDEKTDSADSPNGNSKDAAIIKEALDLPIDTANFISSKPDVFRKIKSFFNVNIELIPSRNQSKTKSFQLSGSQQNIEAVKQFLREMDVTDGCNVQIEPHAIPTFLSKQGAGVHMIERKNRCIIHVDQSGIVTFYGTRADTEEAKKAVESEFLRKNIKIDSCELRCPSEIIVKALSQPKYFRQQLTILKLNETSLTARPGSLPDVIAIRSRGSSSPDAFESIKKTLIDHINNLSFTPLSCTDHYFEAYKQWRTRRTKSKEECDKFYAFSYLSTLDVILGADPKIMMIPDEKTSVVYIVGLESHIKPNLDEISKIVECVSYPPTLFEVSIDLKFMMTQAYFDEVQNTCCVEIRKRYQKRDDETLQYDIFGKTSSQQAALKTLEQEIQKAGHIETYEFESQQTIQLLFKNNLALLSQLREKHQVHINVIKSKNCCKIVGPQKTVEEALTAVRNLDQEQITKDAVLKVVDITLPSTSIIQALLANKGSLVQEIELESGADSIKIDRRAYTLQIRGSQEACAAAAESIRQIIEDNTMEPVNTFTVNTPEIKQPEKSVPSNQLIAVSFTEETFPTLSEMGDDEKVKQRRRKKGY